MLFNLQSILQKVGSTASSKESEYSITYMQYTATPAVAPCDSLNFNGHICTLICPADSGLLSTDCVPKGSSDHKRQDEI